MKLNNWEGIYSAFDEARGEGDVFEGEVWLSKLAERAKAAIAGLDDGSAVATSAQTTDYALPYVAALCAGAEVLRILDFGGGMATSYFPLRAMLPRERKLDFLIIENDTVCNKGAELFGSYPELRYAPALPKSPQRFDIAHFGSSLHYVDDWKGLLKDVSALEPEYLLFVDLPAADNKTFVTVQNFHDRRIPVRFWNLPEFIGYVSQLGYQLLMKSRYRGYYLDRNAEIPTANFDAAHRLTYVTQVIFRRLRDAPL